MKKLLLSSLCMLLLCITELYAQTRTVSGTVTSKDDGLPLPGVTVTVKGTQTGTVSNGDGRFSISVPDNGTLVFTFIGFAAQEVPVTGSTLNVALVATSNQLNDVVVTALGIRKSEKSIGYSVSKVSSEDLIKSGEQNIIQGLAAKTTGVQVTSSSGTPGASSKIVLRGPATFSGDNQPLIVVDGVPISNAVNYPNAGDNPYNNTLSGVQVANRALDINPEDIESVSVLKGPAAAALYGQAAGNGAIIYTTKRGKARNGLGITLSSGVDFARVNKLPKLQNRFGQGSAGKFSSATPNSWGEDLVAAGKPIYNNVDNFFKTGITYNNNVSINGGNDVSTFRIAFGNTNQGGVIPYSKLNRYTLRLTGDSKLSEAITVGGTINYTNSQTQSPSNGSDLSGMMLPLLRMPVGYDGKNNYFDEASRTQKNFFASYDNPFFSSKYNPYNEENNRVVGNVYIDAKLSNVFSLSWKVGGDTYSTNATKLYATSSRGNDAGDGSGQVNRTNVNFRNLYTDLLLKFNKKLGNDFTLSGLLGGNYNYTQYVSSFERGRNLLIPYFYNFSNASELFVSNSESYQNSKAVFLDATLDYKSILFLTVTGRNEWSTTFGRGSKGFFYPKADLAYVFTDLLKNQNVVSYGKVRVAYSNVGISPGVYNNGLYYIQPLVADGATNGYGFPYLGQPGFAISSTIPDKNLKPERNSGLEFGLELKFLNNRISFDGTFYQQTSTNLLITQPIASTSGFQYYYNNVGKVRNRGIELGLSAQAIKSKDFNWDVALNFSKNKNVVLQLAPGVTELSVGSGFSDPQSYAIVGKPFGVFYGAKFQRDASGNVIIDPTSGLPVPEATQQELGSPLPDFLANINNNFTYKSWNFSFLWDFRKGGKIWNGTWQNLNFRGRTAESEGRTQTYVIPGVYANGQPNTKAIDGFTYYSTYMGGGGVTNELSMQDGGWVRLRSVNLSHRFKLQKEGRKSVVQYVEVGGGIRNALLFTKYKGVDPETSLTGAGQNLSGYDYFNNPGTRSFMFNVRVGL